MPRYTKELQELGKKIGEKTLDGMDVVIPKLQRVLYRRQYEWSRMAASKFAKSLGFKPAINPVDNIKRQLNERIIQIVATKKLKHAELAEMSLIPRPRITAILNRHLQCVSIEALIQILSVLGIAISIHQD